MKKTLTILLFVILLNTRLFASMDDVKLKLTKYWGLFTLENNPYLKSLDEDLRNIQGETRVSLDLLLPGGPPKDGVPAIDNPKFVKPNETQFKDDETIIGVYINGEARAYPYAILNWHEIVNDRIQGIPIAVTMCPLCDTNPVFIRTIDGVETTFGVSGKLFQSCLVMFDRLTNTLWSQPWGMGIAGPYTNYSLERIPAYKTTLGRWKIKYPNTVVLSTDTGHNRDYNRYPYGSYTTNQEIIFPVRNQNKRAISAKEIESYIWQPDDQTPKDNYSGLSFHISHEKMKKMEKIEFLYGNQKVIAVWDGELKTVKFFDKKTSREISSSTSFGFVYPAFFE